MPGYPNNICGAPAASPSCGAPGAGSASPPTIYFFRPNYQEPMVQQYNLQFEHQLTQTMSFTVGYLGVRGTHLTRTRDINLNPPSPSSISLAGSPATVFNFLAFPSAHPIAGFSRMFHFVLTEPVNVKRCRTSVAAGPYSPVKSFGFAGNVPRPSVLLIARLRTYEADSETSLLSLELR